MNDIWWWSLEDSYKTRASGKQRRWPSRMRSTQPSDHHISRQVGSDLPKMHRDEVIRNSATFLVLHFHFQRKVHTWRERHNSNSPSGANGTIRTLQLGPGCTVSLFRVFSFTSWSVSPSYREYFPYFPRTDLSGNNMQRLSSSAPTVLLRS